MPYYKDSNLKVHFLDSSTFQHLLPAGCVEISDAEADSLQALPEITTDQLIKQYESALDAHLDSVAQADRWRDRFTFAVRAGYDNPWQAKAKVFGTWMDDCNARAYALLAAVTAGTAELPTVEDFIAAMPTPPVLT